MSLIKIVTACTQTLIDHVEELTALDQAIGDGDHGLNMRRGSLAIQGKLAQFETANMRESLKLMGMTCMATIGGSSGPVFGTLLVTLSKELPDHPQPADLSKAITASIAALTKLGKAQVGQKTLLDVLDPVQKVLNDVGDGANSPELIARVRQCAIDSAQATASMQAIKGRSSFLGDRALGHVDPGSRSMALIICAVCDTL